MQWRYSFEVVLQVGNIIVDVNKIAHNLATKMPSESKRTAKVGLSKFGLTSTKLRKVPKKAFEYNGTCVSSVQAQMRTITIKNFNINLKYEEMLENK